MEWQETELLVRAAWLYYVDQLTQDDLAARLGVSRASAGRLLERARKQGIVRFAIDSEYLPVFELGRRVKDAYRIRDVLVVPALPQIDADQTAVVTRLARGGAQYAQHRLESGSVVGIGWGVAVDRTLQEISIETMSRVSAVSLIGGVDAFLGQWRTNRIRRGQTRDAIIPAPIVVSSEKLAEALMKEDGVSSILERSRSAGMAIIGIGSTQGPATLAELGYASVEELDEYRGQGAVGDVIGLFFDKDGQVMDLPIHRRRIGVSIDDLHRIPCVVAVAGGPHKTAAIRGALRGGHVDVLVTTEAVAHALLEEE